MNEGIMLGREDVTVNRERTRTKRFPYSLKRGFKNNQTRRGCVALETLSVGSQSRHSSCVKPQMFLLHANISACALSRSPFFLRGPRHFVASPIRLGEQRLCVLSQGYISSAKPVKSTSGTRIPRPEAPLRYLGSRHLANTLPLAKSFLSASAFF